MKVHYSAEFCCLCVVLPVACQYCKDEALDAWLDEAKETDYLEWGAF